MYEVIYRDKDGSRKFLELDMPTKTEVFAELKARGLSAICIKESFKSHSKENAISYWTVITTTLIVGGVIFLSLFFCNFKENKINRTKRSLSKESIKPTSTECTIKQSLTKSFVAKRHVVKTLKINKPVIENSGVLFKPEFNGRLVKWKHREKPVFKNTFENFVGSIITAIPGERFLEIDLEDEFDEAFKASLTNRIEVTSEDSEETAELKRAVIEAKEEVRRQVANGMRPRDIVIAARDELNKVADYRDNLQQEFDNYLVTQKDPTEVLQFVKEANDILAEYGALPLDAPDDLESAEEAILNAIENKVLELEKKNEGP